jgi:hypothetical protein
MLLEQLEGEHLEVAEVKEPAFDKKPTITAVSIGNGCAFQPEVGCVVGAAGVLVAAPGMHAFGIDQLFGCQIEASQQVIVEAGGPSFDDFGQAEGLPVCVDEKELVCIVENAKPVREGREMAVATQEIGTE